MGTTLKVSLSTASVQRAIKEVKDYKKSLEAKNKLFVDKLLDIGIEVAKENAVDIPGTFGTHHMGEYVSFSKELSNSKGKSKGLILGMGAEIYSAVNEGRSINSLMALEFGTAALALEPQAMFGVSGGRGTNSRSGHENDLVWWAYTVENGKRIRKKLTAIEPTRPMYHAATEMLLQIQRVAQEVFETNRVVKC